jgi:hypothetical protein
MKCNACGLVNFSEAAACERCGQGVKRAAQRNSRKGSSPGDAGRGSALYTLAILGAIAAVVFYLYSGGSSDPGKRVVTFDANRVAASSSPQPQAALPRTEYQQHRTMPYTEAVRDAPDLKASEARTAEINKLMPPSSNK